MKAEQAYPAIKILLDQVSDIEERKKLENMILGAVESFEKRKKRILERLDRKPRYQIKKK